MEEIGSKLRLLRQSRGITLEMLAQKLDMTQPHLSLIETGKRGISIPTLRRILYALNTTLVGFFSSDFQNNNKVVYRSEDRVLLPSSKSTEIRLLVPIESGRMLSSSETIIKPEGSMGKPTAHKGEEFGFVLEGRGILIVNNQKYDISKGDSFYYDAFRPHTIRNPSKTKDLKLLIVATPPSF